LPPCPVTIGNAIPLGRISIPLRHLPSPCRYKLAVRLEGTGFANDWDVWVYPALPPGEPGDGIVCTSTLAVAGAALAAGNKVLLLIPPAAVAGGVALGFTPIFWNTSCTQGQAPHTLGLVCDPAHPGLAEFPTDAHANWQWWHVVKRAAAMILDGLPPTLRPIVQVIDDWFTNRRLGLVFEARIGPGRLLACSIDLSGDLSAEPVARQLRDSLLRYMNSEQFNPGTEVSLEALGPIWRS